MEFKYRIDCKAPSNFYVNKDNVHEAYFKELRKYPILTDEETTELVNEYKNGKTKSDRERAKQRLIECNLRFVLSVAKKLGTPDTFLDLVSEGNIGLIKAIEKFDLEKNCHLTTYALSWIVAYIKKYQIEQMNAVVPNNAQKLHSYVKNVTREFYNENERNPTPYEIAELVRKKFNFNITNLEDVELGQMISIDEKYGTLDGNGRLEDSDLYNSRTSSNNIQYGIDKEHETAKLNFFLGKLTDKERNVITRYYAIGCEWESLDTIGMNLGLGKERVRQICVGALNKMRSYKNCVEK